MTNHNGMAPCAALIAAVLMASTAHAEQKRCDPGSAAACPEYTAPATTAVPGLPLIDTHGTIPANTPTVLFNGVIPPNGYWIKVSVASTGGGNCYVNDNKTTPNLTQGYLLDIGATDVLQTPAGYHPVGIVTIICAAPENIFARGW